MMKLHRGTLLAEMRTEVNSVHGKNIDELALDVLNLARNTLAIHLRFMDKAIGMLKLQAVPGLNGVAVDGVYIYYDSMSVLPQLGLPINPIVISCSLMHFTFFHRNIFGNVIP